MKYKKKVERMKEMQNWFDKLSQREKSALTRPGSVKHG